MARCPDCGGEVKYKAPFMVCLDCGLSFKRGDLDRVKTEVRAEQKKVMGETTEETEKKERERKRAYHDWYLKKEEK